MGLKMCSDIFHWTLSVPRCSQFSESYCSPLGTNNVRGQISEHIFAPNGDYCLYKAIETLELHCPLIYNHGQKSWDKCALVALYKHAKQRVARDSTYTCPTPPPTPIYNVEHNVFLTFNLYWVGRREL